MQETVDPSAPDALDKELLALPAPPQGRRFATLALMAAVVVGAMALLLSLRHDLGYFFSSEPVVDLGDVTHVDPATLRTDVEVRVAGTPMLSRAVRYRRVLTGSEHVVFPLAGQRTIYVHAEDSAASLARSEFTGRLVTFSELGGRIDIVEGYLAGDMGLPVSGESFLLLADEPPSSYAWSLLLAILCLLFVALDVWLLFRWFRPAKGPSVPVGEDDV
ncbi:MAG: hypothetical protein KC619_11565 [Myxococcales bacterium]|nr:hypothetical protein [Myxococcales bacterium]